MKRTTLYMLIALGTAASALASVAPQESTSGPAFAANENETVVEKNQAYPLVGPLIVEECLDAECTQLRG